MKLHVYNLDFRQQHCHRIYAIATFGHKFTLALLQRLSVCDVDVIGYACSKLSRIEAESGNGVRAAASARCV